MPPALAALVISRLSRRRIFRAWRAVVSDAADALAREKETEAAAVAAAAEATDLAREGSDCCGGGGFSGCGARRLSKGEKAAAVAARLAAATEELSRARLNAWRR